MHSSEITHANTPQPALLTDLLPGKPAGELEGGASLALTAHRKPLPALTGLRFFAALHVIIFHTAAKTTLFAHGYLFAGNILANGYLAVTLFFMLSGFILAYNYTGQIETRSHAFRFWEARFARIWPAYAFSLACSSLPLSRIPHWPIALATIFMVQAWDPVHAIFSAAWNGVCWSLSAEAFFYLFFPWIQTSIERMRRPWIQGFGLFCAAAGILWGGPNFTSSDRFPGLFSYIIIPIIHLPEFIAGMVLGNVFLNLSRNADPASPDISRSAARKFPWFTACGAASSILIIGTLRNHWTSLVIGSFSMMIYGIAAERSMLSRFLSTRLLILGGEISYSMYLLRTPLHVWINFVPAFGANSIVSLLYLPFGLIPLSLFSYYLIEGPSRRGLRRFFASLQNRMN